MGLTEKIDEATNVYINNRFEFRVEYPAEWNVKEEAFFEASLEHNTSPDEGITIYINNEKDDTIYVFGQSGHINIESPGFLREDFITNSGLRGDLL